MEQNKTNPPIIEQIKEFIETKIRLYKYIAIDKTTTIASSVIAYAIIAVLGLFILMFATITLALALGSLIGSYWAGFGIVTLIFIILAVLVLVLKAKYIEAPLIEFFISKFFKDNSK
ncbi:MAG: phage holin family protein [Mucilaginibacter sp.]|uniref:phage holin family protein n=1 Tax=Mucilaginibacter sp. TaxID=1882438 RepID=UPI0034E530DF